MNVFEKIKNFISGKSMLRLPEKSILSGENMDRTWPFITIDAVESLIRNQDTFEKFMNFDENKDFFGELNAERFAETVKIYAEFMKDKGVIFSPKERKRIRKIESFLPEKKKKQVLIFKSYNGISKKKLYKIATKLVCSNEEMSKFWVCQRDNKDYNGISSEVISDYISTELNELRSKIAFNYMAEKNILFLANKREIINNNTYKVNALYQMNPEFEQSIMSTVMPSKNKTELAFQLYNELNKRVKYNPSFFALGQNLDDEFARRIFYKPIDEITPEDNSIICKQWAELYAYLLEKIGFEAYVQGIKGHKNVVAFYGATRIEADATNVIQNYDDNSNLTDLTRCKLGIRPAGFKAYGRIGDKKEIESLNKMQLNEDLTFLTQETGVDEKVEEILDIIDDKRELSDVIMKLKDSNSNIRTIIKKIEFMSEMLQKSKLDNMDSVGYLRHLFKNVMDFGEKIITTICNSYFTEVYSDNCNLLPIISVNISENGEGVEETDFLYFIYDQNTHTINPIKSEDLREKIQSGELNKGKNKKRCEFIPGLENADIQIIINENIEKNGVETTKPNGMIVTTKCDEENKNQDDSERTFDDN